MTDTITALYAALDEPDADVTHILGLLADAYMDAGDEWRSEAVRWLRDNKKYPRYGGSLISWSFFRSSRTRYLPEKLCAATVPWCEAVSDAFRDVVDAYHGLRAHGEEPVAGIDSERMVS